MSRLPRRLAFSIKPTVHAAPSLRRTAAPLACSLLLAGCGSVQPALDVGFSSARDRASSREVGPGSRFRPGPTGALVARAGPLDGMSCRHSYPVSAVAHVELFAADRVVIIPAGIGIAPPLRRHGAFVLGGRCMYPLRTVEPTGVVLLGAGRGFTLGRLFALWGEPLGHREVAGFRAGAGQEVAVYRDGARWRGDPARAPLSGGMQITIELGPFVPPHARYDFPPLPSFSGR